MPFFKHFVLFFFLLLVITLLDYFYLGRPAIGIDDANIFMTYARHLNQGEGFVFNSGGERVEGFTSFLWVLVNWLFFSFSTHPEIGILFFLLLLNAATCTLVYEEVKKEAILLNLSFSHKFLLPLFVVFLLCIGPVHQVWSALSLMENGLWDFLFISLIVLILQAFRNGYTSFAQKAALCGAGVLLLLTRPEGIAWTLVFSILLFLAARRNRTGFLFPLVFLLLMGITMAALTLFRERYFGYPLPNTYYAKVSHNRLYNLKEGLKYAFSFVTNFHPLISFFLTALIATVIAFSKRLRIFSRNDSAEGAASEFLLRLSIVALVLLGALCIPLTTGGDHFGGFRFYQSTLLLLAWAFPAFLFLYDQRSHAGAKAVRLFLVILVVCFGLLTGGTLTDLKNIPQTRMNFEFSLASEGREVADALDALWPANKPSVGVIAVGGFAYSYDGNTVDLMGLNNTLMGHSSGDRIGIKNHAAFNKDVFYQFNADLLLPKRVGDEKEGRKRYAELLDTENFDNEAMKNIFNDERFAEAYQPLLLEKNGIRLFCFASHAMWQRLASDSSFRLTKLGL